MGTGKSFTVSGLTLGGADAANYTLDPASSTTGTGSITQLASVTWSGPAAGGNWSDAANWGSAMPDRGNVGLAIIPSSVTGTVVADTANSYTGKVQVNGGTLSVGVETYLGAVPSSVVTDAITLNGGSLQFTDNITLNANRGIVLDTNGGSFAVDASKSVNYAGVMAGTGGLVKSGNGSMTLSGANNYAGGTSIAAGSLKLGIASVGTVGAVTSGALGTAAITVSSGAALDLNGMTLPNALSVAGTGISSGGVLFNSAATAASVTGPITLTGNSTFISTPGITLSSITGSAYALNITAGTGAGTGDITFNGAVSIGGESISSFTASRNINIYNTISVNGTTSASGLALVYNKANSTGDYSLGFTTTGSGANVVASFLGSIDFASTSSSFSTQNNLTAKNYILVDAFTSTNPTTSTFYCATTAQCGTNAQNFALARNIDASTFTTTGAAGGAKYANMRALGTLNATYSGTFAGLGHTITGLSLSGTSNVGLFQSTASGVTM